MFLSNNFYVQNNLRQSWTKGKILFSVPFPPIFTVEECKKKLKSEPASYHIYFNIE